MGESYDAAHGLNRGANGAWSDKKQGLPEISLVGRSPRVIAALQGLRRAIPGASMIRMVVVTKDDWTTELDFPPMVDEVYVDSDMGGCPGRARVEPHENPRVRGALAAATRALSKVTDATELGEEYDEADERGHIHLHF
jgi:hypothetical protein